MLLENLQSDIKKLANSSKAKILARFFKTGPGQYGEGDQFLGLTVPQSRQLVHKYKDLSFPEISQLITSKYHEERLIALLILVHQFPKKLAKSKSLWERRIAVLSTFAFTYKGDSQPTLKIAEILLHDKEDLIHKAVGWLLREVDKRCGQKYLTDFLDQHNRSMPRTTLRYSIERFPNDLRVKYLTGVI